MSYHEKTNQQTMIKILQVVSHIQTMMPNQKQSDNEATRKHINYWPTDCVSADNLQKN